MRVYIETTIPSYLTSWPSPQVVHAGHQISTRDWWDNHRQRFELFTSLVTHQEAASGDPLAAQRRMDSLSSSFGHDLKATCRALYAEQQKHPGDFLNLGAALQKGKVSHPAPGPQPVR